MTSGDKPREACGVAGAWDTQGDVVPLVRTMLIALQHRGQEAAGVVACAAGRLTRRAGSGLATDVLRDAPGLPAGPGAVGHVRYATSGAGPDGAQPVLLPGVPPLALAHNGTLVDAALHLDVPGPGIATDTELLTRAIHAAVSRRGLDLGSAVHEVLPRLDGAYALVLTDGRHLYGIRDPHGFRPLCLGRRGTTWLLASESSAVEAAGGETVRELEPGEVLRIGSEGFRSSRLTAPGVRRASCLFEYVYFARPDSRLSGRSVYESRYAAGRALADQAPVSGTGVETVVVAVPDTARVAADGYARRAGLPVVQGLLRHSGVGRSFITPGQGAREEAVRLKLSAIPAAVRGRRVVLVDDSLVRGTTMTAVTGMLRAAGAAEIHLRIASPPHRWPCFYGIDTDRGGGLLAAGTPPEGFAAVLGCDSAEFLELDRLLATAGGDPDDYCTACLTGRFPAAVPRTYQLQPRPEPRPST